MAAKTINTRIQLKNDTEANWKKSVLPADNSQGTKVSGTSFVPLLGELIIFSADDAHPFSRLKVGNGTDDVLTLPFIDAGTINGEVLSEIIIQRDVRANFPAVGSTNNLYIDLSTNEVYCWKNTNGYTKLLNFSYTSASIINNWSAGIMTSASAAGATLTIVNGTAPTLEYDTISVVKDINGSGA